MPHLIQVASVPFHVLIKIIKAVRIFIVSFMVVIASLPEVWIVGAKFGVGHGVSPVLPDLLGQIPRYNAWSVPTLG